MQDSNEVLEVRRFKPEDMIIKERQGQAIDDFESATTPMGKTANLLCNNGIHADLERQQYRLYDSETGLWRKISKPTYELNINLLYNKLVRASYDTLKPIPMKYMDEIQLKMSFQNRRVVADEWNDKKPSSTNVIPFANKVLNLDNNSAVKFHKELYLENKLEREYKPEDGESCPKWKELINHLSQGNESVADTLEAFAYLSMAGRGRLERCILSLYSEIGRSGKGTYINALQTLVGKDRSAVGEIARLTDDTTVSSFENKTLIAFPEEREVLTSRSNSYARLLKLSSKDYVSGRIVHSPETFRFRANAMMIFASNMSVLPADSGGARRTIYLRCVPIPDGEEDRDLGYKIEQEMTRITNRLINKFTRESAQAIIESAYNNPVFMECAKNNASETSSVHKFLEEMIIPICAINNGRDLYMSEYKKHDRAYNINGTIPVVSTQSLYNGYKLYLLENNPSSRPMSRTRFELDTRTYYIQHMDHSIYFVKDLIPGLVGVKSRILGLSFNPETWVDQYSQYKP